MYGLNFFCLLPVSVCIDDYVMIGSYIAPDKDWRQLGIYPPLFGLIGYFKF